MPVKRNYETIFIIKPDLEEEEREKIIERIKNLIEKNNGEIDEIEKMGTRKLAYEIRDYKSGYYTRIEFTGTTDIVDELEYDYRILDDIIRYLTVKN